ncbi:MAG: NUDIX domain-containing protein [archaeon]
MEELLEIIDENDNIIGHATYKEAHEKGLLHRASDVFVFKDDSYQEMLLNLRSKKMKYPGTLCNPGGHPKPGETPIETAKTELQEEMFFEHQLPEELVFEKMLEENFRIDKEHTIITLYRVIYPGPFYNDPKEVEDFFFMKMDDLIKDIKDNPEKYSLFFRMMFAKYLKLLHSKI